MSMIQRGVQFRGVVNDLRRCTNAIRFVCYFFSLQTVVYWTLIDYRQGKGWVGGIFFALRRGNVARLYQNRIN